MNREEEAQLLAALNGEFGEDAQEEVEDWMEDNGYEVTEYDDEEYDDEEAAAAIESELGRLERKIGRNLTDAEVGRIVQDLPQGEIPDLAEKHSDLKDRVLETDSRVALMAEAAEDARQAQVEAEDGAVA